MSARIVLAIIGAPHGVRGEVRVKLFSQAADALTAYGALSTEDGQTLSAQSVRPIKDDMVVVRFKGVNDRSGAEALNRKTLSVLRSALPPLEEDELYHADLIGLAASTPAGVALGHVIAVHDFGAGDMLEVKGEGPSQLYAFTKAIVPVIDVRAGTLIIDTPGMVEGEEA
jgi:16S rRNA processing protein RimM